MEHKFANRQIGIDFSSVLNLRDHSKWRAKRKKTRGGDNTHPNVRSKSNK